MLFIFMDVLAIIFWCYEKNIQQTTKNSLKRIFIYEKKKLMGLQAGVNETGYDFQKRKAA